MIYAAARVFAERGYEATSIEDLLRATGMTRGGLYHYTASKRELLLGVLDELMDPLIERVREILDGPGKPEQQLRDVMRVWLAHVATHRHHMIVLSQERRTLEQGSGFDRARHARTRFEAMLAEILNRGKCDGSFSMPDTRLSLLMLLGMVNYVPQWYTSSGRRTPGEISELYCDMLLDGIRGRRPT